MKRLVLILLVSFLVVGMIPVSAAPPEMNIPAKSSLLMDISTGTPA